MKHFRTIIATLLLTSLAGLALADSSKPNIVVFLADDLGWGDTSPYGNTEIKTPNLAKLAAQGVKFNQCYSACGVCSPSRSAILTGRTPYRNGVWQHLSGNHEAHLRTSEITYPKLLKEIGYETCHVGKWHLNSKPQFKGMIMDALEAKGLVENTLFFFSSDNGPEGKGGIKGGSTGGLRGRKRDDYEGGIRVPGIVRWPGHIQAGTVSDVPVIGTDIFATVLDVTGVELPKDRTIDGVSMVPIFSGQSVERKVPLFWRTHCSPQQDRVAMRIGDWKIIGNDRLTTFELYEIQKDWKEENNLAGTMPEKAQEMKDALLKVWKEIETEGPKEWWQHGTGGTKKDRGLNY